MFVFNLPDPGEGLLEAEIARWLVKPGDKVKVNDFIAEVETAKSLVELPSPVEGTVTKLFAAESDTVEVGAPLIEFVLEDEVAAESAFSEEPEKSQPMLVGSGPTVSMRTRRTRVTTSAAKSTQKVEPSCQILSGSSPSDNQISSEPKLSLARAVQCSNRALVLAKPLVRKLARDLGVELADVKGSGPRGIIRRADVEDVAKHLAGKDPAVTDVPEEWRVPIRGVRKTTAKNLTASVKEHVMVTEWVDVEVSETMQLVKSLKKRDALGARVSPLLFVARACCQALEKFPDLNAGWNDKAREIVYHREVNLGIAADTPRGLMVPNIKGAQRMSLRELAHALNELVQVARRDGLQPSDYSRGTFTITNVGVFGVDAGTPIINGDETAILCIGAITRRPWVVEDDGNERIEPRWVTTLAFTFDHRLIDGAQGSSFLREVADLLHQPSLMLLD